MNKRWIFAFSVIPPDCTVSIRYGAAVMFGYYSKWLDQWFAVNGGRETRVEPPQMIFVSEEYARSHRRDLGQVRSYRENPLRIRKQKVEQMLMPI